MLYYSDGEAFTGSRTAYLDTIENHPGSRIFIAVKFGNLPTTLAMVDTGAPWCILGKEQAAALNPNYRNEAIDSTKLVIRSWEYGGILIRLPITLCAEEGYDITIDGTVFIPEDEPSLPNFIGLEGFLHRIKFAVDPENNHFYFGAF
jgi:hypothetical protein